MKKEFLLLSGALLCSMSMVADDGVMTALLPEGVTANITHEEREYGQNTIMVAGSAEKGYRVFFAATDADHGEELWVSDGTPEGTKLVKDIYPGATSSQIQYITRFNDKVIFSATTEDYGNEPWISDGTEDGTYMLKDIHEIGDSKPVGFQQLNENQFVFFAMDLDSETYKDGGEKWLYVSDGTEEGTKLVAEIDCDFLGREPGDNRWGCVVRVGRKVFFIGDAADKTGVTYGDELYVTDGTPEGTHLVKDINIELNSNKEDGSTNGAAIAHLCNFYNEKLFFKAWSWVSGNEPWATDGTEENTYEIYNTNPNVNPDNVNIFDGVEVPMGNGGGVTKVGAPWNGYICFRSYTPETRDELGVTNCEKGDYRVFDIDTYAPTKDNSSYPDDGVPFDGYYVFCANTGTRQGVEEPAQLGGELQVFDGNSVRTQYDFNPGTGCTWTRELSVVNGTLYWSNSGNKDNRNWTLTRLDKVDGGVPVTISNFHPTDDQVYCLRNMGGKLVFYSGATHNIYCYEYENPDKDLTKNPDNCEIEYRTRKEIAEGGSVESIFGNADLNAPVEFFNIQGMRVSGNEPGLYIRRQGNTTTKVVVK